MLVRCGLPEPDLNQAIVSTEDRRVLLGVLDMGWCIKQPDGRMIKVAGEYQGREFHDGESERSRDACKRRGFENDGWAFEEIWDEHMANSEARRETVCRFAGAMRIPRDELNLSEADPHFFSQHAIELAIQRDARRRRPQRNESDRWD